MANGILQKKQCGRQNKTIKPSGRLNKKNRNDMANGILP